MNNHHQKNLENQLEEQKQLLLKQEEKLTELSSLVEERGMEISELRYLISSEFKRLHGDLDYILNRLSLKERVKGLLKGSKRLAQKVQAQKRERQEDLKGIKTRSIEEQQKTRSPEIGDGERLLAKAKEIESWPLELSIIMNWECNYHCSYCFAKKPKDKSEFRAHTAAEWGDRLVAFHEKFGKCRVTLTGGEPLMYGDAIDMIIRATRYHHVSVGTNLSIHEGKLKRLVEESNIENLLLSPSYHLEHASIDAFIGKCLFLKEKEVVVWSSAVAYPKYLKEMLDIRDKFEKNGLGIGFFPFIGEYKGRHFPADYSEEELKILNQLPGWHEQAGTADGKPIELPKVKGMRCYAGVKFISINPAGEVVRCIPVNQVIGNIFDPDFSPLRNPDRCPVEICDCEVYWKYHLR